MKLLLTVTAAACFLATSCQKESGAAGNAGSEIADRSQLPPLTIHAHDWGPAPVRNIYASNNLYNQEAPALQVETWLSDKPDTKGKFVIVDFWATWCPPCRKTIPELNAIARAFKDEVVVIGISGDKSADTVRSMKKPVIEYSSAIDTQQRNSAEIGIKAIPHLLVIDPNGKVCWQGFPGDKDYPFNHKVLSELISTYRSSAK